MSSQRLFAEQFSEGLRKTIAEASLIKTHGKVTHVTGTIIRAHLANVKVGELCTLYCPSTNQRQLAEVVGFEHQQALLTPLGDLAGISSSTQVIATGKMLEVAVGDHLLGQVLNGLGQPLQSTTLTPTTTDNSAAAYYPVLADAPAPLDRQLINSPLSLGVKAIDGLLTCGAGQRLGIFAAAGGGKSTLLSMLAKGACVDVIVIALIGERGREVREFIEHSLTEETRQRAVLVVATSDRPAMERTKAAFVATTIAEFFRDQGKQVLLLMDSVTRFARAQREIGLAAGEPPTRRGFPPSVFATLPKLLERAGPAAKGSITGLYTVLVEGDDLNEPVADETRSILDGHIILSRELAAANHYPAIDILQSSSRVMNHIVSPDQQMAAGQVRQWMAKYKAAELLLKVGEYQQGSDLETDQAIAKWPAIQAFLQQPQNQQNSVEATYSQLIELAN
ncbi:type III secretion system ATPase SctN [Spartinivicinus ruber]|uniref:type III secretion system ATPase SctN n=1 Tax=Spartinivicinus ruber TaxID=2683272 RepID=UPI002E30B813|nr:type III secretion system ATPase SctN [Spartinivicinus ruber]